MIAIQRDVSYHIYITKKELPYLSKEGNSILYCVVVTIEWRVKT